MLTLRSSFLITGAATLFLESATPLRVIRHEPDETASPTSVITVTFDRPVAGALDYSVDADTVVRIEPAPRGRLEWRDPVTVRFTPAAPLPYGSRYTVTVRDNFRA